MSRIPGPILRAHNPHPLINQPVTSAGLTANSGPNPAASLEPVAPVRPDRPDHCGHRWRVPARLLTVAAAAAALLALPSAAAVAADPGPVVVVAANALPVVIANLQAWVMGILAAVASLFLVLAGVYWATAGGDPAQVDKAKGALKNALGGYGLAVLAPILLDVVKGIVGG